MVGGWWITYILDGLLGRVGQVADGKGGGREGSATGQDVAAGSQGLLRYVVRRYKEQEDNRGEMVVSQSTFP